MNQPNNLPRSPHIHETATTIAQASTEEECAPFFIDLNSLTERQLDHLRSVGLLPPLSVDSRNDNDGRIRLIDDQDDGDADGEDAAEFPVQRTNNGMMPSPSSSHDLDPYAIRLMRSAHINYLVNALSNPLSRGFVSLDASHPWMVYWCLHSLDLLGYFDHDASDSADNASRILHDVEVMQKGQLLKRVVSTLQACWTEAWVDLPTADVMGDVRLTQLWRQQQNQQRQQKQLEDVGTQCNQQQKQPHDTSLISILAGGFGGGPNQMPHCAPTYAAVLALSIVSSLGLGVQQQSQSHPFHEAGQLAIDLLTQTRLQLFAFFVSLRVDQSDQCHGVPSTAFRMQHDGEMDVRASYCLLAPCHLLGLLQENGSAAHQVGGSCNLLTSPAIARHIASCQTYEGGFGAEPHNEAHGGYTFCALAALRILNAMDSIDVCALRSWLARRQLGYEGGFCGRTNKLVDGCYSFWQGGAVALLDGWYIENESNSIGTDAAGGATGCNSSKQTSTRDNSIEHELTFDELLLQRYILLCAQDVNGGLRDKPSKPRDFYHSCYNLSGLSVAQHSPQWSWPQKEDCFEKSDMECNSLFGDGSFNVVGRTDPVINIRVERVQFMLAQKF
ncbi:hypothetical protein HJC23_003600 [Cyclotella cryptica]|uniref:Protein farnesyltransferase subunit beta n=1 Tax=Cyclotella cryptica TaxID=29204 RepID=A0ABD3QIM6_9STRA|eukprot:CCRYP_004880-RA/>CCRYP_004880-RA protein AED:0.03 eAED:0.03 QI:0/-1/0/1/-1/1/1/0/613